MKHRYICSGGHRFKSDEDNPLCPHCAGTATPIEWKKVDDGGSNKKKERRSRSIIGDALGVVTGGLMTGLPSSTGSEEIQHDGFKGKEGKFGGGGASGSF